MKRIWIAIALILSCLVLSICELLFIDNNCDMYTKMINEVEFYYSNKEYIKALDIARDTYSNWSKEEKKLKAFLLHSDIDDITDSMEDIKDYAKDKDEKKFCDACKKTKRQLLSIKENELPFIENIM